MRANSATTVEPLSNWTIMASPQRSVRPPHVKQAGASELMASPLHSLPAADGPPIEERRLHQRFNDSIWLHFSSQHGGLGYML